MKIFCSIKAKMPITDNLIRNSIFLMMATVANAGLGFLFWLIAAKIYPSEDIGIATALVSSMGLVILLSRFGFDQSMISYFPSGDKSKIFSTAFIATILLTLIIGIAFIYLVGYWSPDLAIIQSKPLSYLGFVIGNALFPLCGMAFVALRKSEYSFYQNIFSGFRIVLLPPFLAFGSWGIISSIGLSYIVITLFSMLKLTKFDLHLRSFDLDFLERSFRFSFGNYVVSFLTTAPNLIMPIVVLDLLGAEQTAIYYIIFTIASILFLIPNSVSTSLFVEGSHGENLRENLIKTVIFILVLLTISTCTLWLLGDMILGVFGETYKSGFTLLLLFAISSYFYSISQIYFSIIRIFRHMNELILLSLISFILVIGIGYLLIPQVGIEGVGYAWILSYSIVAVIIGFNQLCKRLPKRYVHLGT